MGRRLGVALDSVQSGFYVSVDLNRNSVSGMGQEYLKLTITLVTRGRCVLQMVELVEEIHRKYSKRG